VTLRFFRRKPGTTGTQRGESASEAKPATTKTTEAKVPENTSTPARRRRASSTGASGAGTRARTPAPEPKDAPPATKPRTRRGRRGGARRSKAAAPEAAAPETQRIAPAAVIPIRRPERAPEVTKPPADGQLATLAAIQSALTAIEQRLVGSERAAQTAARARVGIFVDVPNVMYAAEREHAKLDYAKLLRFIVRDRELVRASAYAPISDDMQLKLETQKFVQPFVDLGYRIVTKPWKRFADGTLKANFDVELAIDILTMSDRLDIVTLVSGDGDFRRLVELVESKGVRVEVVAFGPSTAAELRAVADEYIDLNDHLAELHA
jgi:uncharacterized LabA/DUF88 family protein